MTFPREIFDQLKFYVYRLIDPRSGQTFYVGKGRGNRVFDHAAGTAKVEDLGENDDDFSLKLQHILSIRNAGFEVQHVVHRHGLTEDEAFEVEAALMDAYDGLTNIASGRGSSERGARHAKQIIETYAAKATDFKHSVVAISVRRSSEYQSWYEAVRGCWKIDRNRASSVDYVLAESEGVVGEVFLAEKWVEAEPEYCDWLETGIPGRSAFIGKVAPQDIRDLYVRTRLPARQRGAAYPIRYFP